MELPTTIEGCLEALRKERKFDEDPETRIFYSRHLPAVSARIATPRLKEIIDIVRPLPKEALCVPGSPGQDILTYLEYRKSNPSYGGEFRRACLYHASGKIPEGFDAEYADSLDDAYSYSITVPTAWLVCPAEELKKLVLKKVYDDLQDHIYELRSEVDRVVEAREMLWADFSEYLCSDERKATKEV